MAVRRSTILKGYCLAALLAFAAVARAADAPHPALAALDTAGIWKLLEPPRIFGPENLYEEIDGEAELFLPYGMKRLTVGVVGERSAPGNEVRVELYRMESPRDAFGVYSQHRYPDQEITSVPPSEVILSETSADFYRGETFVRLRAKPGEASRRLVAGLSKDLVASLPGDGGFPEEAAVLEKLPGMVRGSVIYQKRAMLGYECLAPGFEGRLTGASASGRLLLLPPVPGKEGAARRTRLSRELPEYSPADPALFRAKLPSGTLWLSPSGSCVLGLAGEVPREEAGRILATLAGEAKRVCREERR